MCDLWRTHPLRITLDRQNEGDIDPHMAVAVSGTSAHSNEHGRTAYYQTQWHGCSSVSTAVQNLLGAPLALHSDYWWGPDNDPLRSYMDGLSIYNRKNLLNVGREVERFFSMCLLKHNHY